MREWAFAGARMMVVGPLLLFHRRDAESAEKNAELQVKLAPGVRCQDFDSLLLSASSASLR
jgi:hypothetical protein